MVSDLNEKINNERLCHTQIESDAQTLEELKKREIADLNAKIDSLICKLETSDKTIENL